MALETFCSMQLVQSDKSGWGGDGTLTNQVIKKEKSPQETQPQGNLPEETRAMLGMKVRVDQLQNTTAAFSIC